MQAKTKIQIRLFAESEKAYADFQGGLIPGVPREKVIGVRTPTLRKYSAELYGTYEAKKFLSSLPHEYHEENNLHAFLIEKNKDFDECVRELERFLPYVDNWATCDGMSPKVFAANRENLLPYIEKWLASSHVYTVRYGMLMLMKHFLGDHFRAEYADAVAAVKSEEYYVNMALAWLISFCLIKEYEKTIFLIEKRTLDKWVHNKSIQKALESYRVPLDKKDYLRSLKIK